MRGDGKYYALVGLVFIILFAINYASPDPTNYNHTFSHLDKNPYGGYVLKDMMPDLFGDKEVRNLNLTLYELEEELTPDINLLILADELNAGKEDIDVLLNAVNEGMDAMIISTEMYQLADTLDFYSAYNELDYVLTANQDSSFLTFANPALPGNEFRFKRDAISRHFDGLDSIDYRVIAQNSDEEPVAIQVPYGKGNLYLGTTPLAFTNNYLFFEENHAFAATMLSFLSKKDLLWCEYYQMGRLEIQTPLRVVLTRPALKLAYTVAIISLLLFMLFEAKRKQRIIPVIRPLANTTLEFIGTIANLYMRNKDHGDIARKRIQYFQEYIHAHYFMNFKKFDQSFFEKLAAKSGNEVVEVKKLFDLIQRVKEQDRVSEQELKLLSDKIEAFYGRKHR